METYSGSYRVTPNQIRQDKVDIELGDWVLTGDANDYAMFLRSLTQADSEYGWAFCLRADELMEARQIEIRSTRNANRPLFSGVVAITRVIRDEGNSVQAYFRPKISINPTRYLWYQPNPDRIASDPESWEFDSLNPRAHLPSRSVAGVSFRTRERSLDGNDNVLIDEWNRFGRPEAWGIHLRIYLEAVVTFFDRAFQAATAETAATIGRGSAWRTNLKTAESYVEFAPPNDVHPIAWVHSAEHALCSASAGAQIRDYEVRGNGSSGQNSRFLRLRFSDNRELRVYAKTNRRVRVEVFHDFTRYHASILHRRTNSESHTARTANQIGNWLLGSVASDASSLINHALGRIQSIAGAPSGYPAYRLVSTIYRVCGVSHGHTVLHALAINQRITLSRTRDYLRPYIRRLESEGVLERTGTGRHDPVFSVTAPYQRALRALSR